MQADQIVQPWQDWLLEMLRIFIIIVLNICVIAAAGLLCPDAPPIFWV